MFSTRTRPIARAAAVTAVAGAAMIALTAPAAAQPPTEEVCSAPRDGVSVCQVQSTAADANGFRWISGRLKAEPGVIIVVGFVAVEACGAPCRSLVPTAGSNTTEIVTPAVIWGRSSYTANASWIDGQGRRHSGVSSWPPGN